MFCSLLLLSCKKDHSDTTCFAKAEKITVENGNENSPKLKVDDSSSPAQFIVSSNQGSGQTEQNCNQNMDDSMSKDKICPLLEKGMKYWYLKKIGSVSSQTKVSCN